MLFLNRLRKIVVESDNADNFGQEAVANTTSKRLMVRQDLGRNIVCLSDGPTKEHWFVLKKDFSSMPQRKQDEADSGVTEIALAFRTHKSSPLLDMGADERYPVYAFLPVANYGFKFIIHADWLLSSSRESVNKINTFNEVVRDRVSELFVEAVERVCADNTGDAAANSSTGHLGVADILQLIPLEQEVGHGDGFFIPVATNISNALQRISCIPIDDPGTGKTLCRPSEAMWVTAAQRTVIDQALFLEHFDPPRYFVRDDVLISVHPQILTTALGIEQLQVQHVLELLEKLPLSLQQKNGKGWIEKILKLLHSMGALRDPASKERIRRSLYMPLSSGKWTTVAGNLPQAVFLRDRTGLNELLRDQVAIVDLGANSPKVTQALRELGVAIPKEKDLIKLHILPSLRNKGDTPSVDKEVFKQLCYLNYAFGKGGPLTIERDLTLWNEIKEQLLVPVHVIQLTAHTDRGKRTSQDGSSRAVMAKYKWTRIGMRRSILQQVHLPSTQNHTNWITGAGMPTSTGKKVNPTPAIYGNTGKRLAAAVGWLVCDIDALVTPDFSAASWDSFFRKVGLQDGFSFKETSKQQICATVLPWSQIEWSGVDPTRTPFYGTDHDCNQLKAVLSTFFARPAVALTRELSQTPSYGFEFECDANGMAIITSVASSGPALGQLRVGDILVTVNTTNTVHLQHAAIDSLLTETPSANITVRSEQIETTSTTEFAGRQYVEFVASAENSKEAAFRSARAQDRCQTLQRIRNSILANLDDIMDKHAQATCSASKGYGKHMFVPLSAAVKTGARETARAQLYTAPSSLIQYLHHQDWLPHSNGLPPSNRRYGTPCPPSDDSAPQQQRSFSPTHSFVRSDGVYKIAGDHVNYVPYVPDVDQKRCDEFWSRLDVRTDADITAPLVLSLLKSWSENSKDEAFETTPEHMFNVRPHHPCCTYTQFLPIFGLFFGIQAGYVNHTY